MTSRIEAATPRTASARLSQIVLPSLSSDLLQLGVEFVEDCLGVDALGARLLDPVLDDRARALLGLGLHRGVGGDDARARCLERVEPDLIGFVPGLAVAARRVLEAILLDDLLVLRRELVPLALIHEEPERRAVQAAGEDGALA